MTYKYDDTSPYAYSLNNPIRYLDPNGLEVINADKANRDKKQEELEKAKSAHAENLKAQGIESTEGMSKKEMKNAGVWKTQKAQNKAQRQFNRAENSFLATEKTINEFKANDPESFSKLDNLTYNGKTIDVHITSRGSTNGNIKSAQTLWGYSNERDRIYSVLPYETENTLDVVSILIQSVNSPDVKLAHEAGHVIGLVRDPAKYKAKFQKGIDCQDPDNAQLYQVRDAIILQKTYTQKKRANGN